MSAELYLTQILQKYAAQSLSNHFFSIVQLKSILKSWASACYVAILDSGSRVKGTAISLASDVDFLVSLSSECNQNTGGLKSIYDSLYNTLYRTYQNVRKQNVSVRLDLNGLQVDVTPARKQNGVGNYHSIYLSKSDSWRQTNTQIHIVDISNSGRLNEIKILKIWRELHQLDFPSVYLEYLLVDVILLNRSKAPNDFATNAWFALNELARDFGNPLSSRIVDPANSNNILSDLLTITEKNRIIAAAKVAITKRYWAEIVW